MKILTFNINSLRARFHQLQAIIDTIDPDIIGLQETKVQDQDFPIQTITDLGYHVVFHGQKTHYGVATLSKMPIKTLHKNFPNEDPDSQRRTLITEHETPLGNIRLINGYFPQGENRKHETKFPAKRNYYQDLITYARNTMNEQPEQPLVIIGDFNIAPADADVGIDTAESWLKRGSCCFLPEEREWFQQLMDLGFTDTWRTLNPDENKRFSWFDYRTKEFDRTEKKGLRIDHILVNQPLQNKIQQGDMNYPIRSMEKPSDHVPVWIEFATPLTI